jgi:hypothetical protein
VPLLTPSDRPVLPILTETRPPRRVSCFQGRFVPFEKRINLLEACVILGIRSASPYSSVCPFPSLPTVMMRFGVWDFTVVVLRDPNPSLVALAPSAPQSITTPKDSVETL